MFGRQFASLSLVFLRFLRCGPAAIFWFIISVVVNAVDPRPDRPFSHVGQKILKIIPPVAYCNSAPAVSVKRRIVRIPTSIPHALPSAIGSIPSATLSVRTIKTVMPENELEMLAFNPPVLRGRMFRYFRFSAASALAKAVHVCVSALLYMVLVSLSPGCLQAQGFRIEPSPVSSSLTSPGVLSTLQATVHLCAYPNNAVPCSNLAQTYSDATLTTPCSLSTQVVLDGTNSCVAQTDTRGNFGFWVAAGTYTYTLTISTGQSFGPFYWSVGIPAGSTVTGPFTVNGTLLVTSLTTGRCVQTTGTAPNISLVSASGPCGTSTGTLTATGSPVSSDCGFFSAPTSLTGTANCTYASASGFVQTQGANNTDAFEILRFTDSSPTGNFLHFRNAANNADLFTLGVNGAATSATSFIAPVFQSSSANPSATGIFRLASGDSLNFRNAANSADIAFAKNGSDQPTFNGNILPTINGAVTNGHLATFANSGQIQDGGAAAVIPTLSTASMSGTVALTGGVLTSLASGGMTITVTMPASGCPCRVQVPYTFTWNAASNANVDGIVTDGSNSFGPCEATIAFNGTWTGCSASYFSPVTYSNGANVTFTVEAQSNANSTVEAGQQRAGFPNGMQVLVFTAN